MACDDVAAIFIDLFARLGDDGTEELFSGLFEQALEELIDAELTSQIGAERYERTEARSVWCNGAQTSALSTPTCDVETRIPQLRWGRSSRCSWSRAGGSTTRCGRRS